MPIIQDPKILAEAKARLQSIQTVKDTEPIIQNNSNKEKKFHTPKELISSTRPDEMIAIIGAPGSGKTTSIIIGKDINNIQSTDGFPNRQWLDFDNKCPAGEQTIPFWNSGFCDTIYKPTPGFGVSNRRDAFKRWLEQNHKLFVQGQTIILDSWSLLMTAFYIQTYREWDLMPTNKDGERNGYFVWTSLIRYAREILDMLKGMNCRRIVTFHETRERDEKDRLTGKLKPLMDGQFKDQILGYFTDVYRQCKDPIKKDERGKNVTVGTGFAYEKGWFWQLVSDETMDCNMNPTLGTKVRRKNLRLINARYQSLEELYNS